MNTTAAASAAVRPRMTRNCCWRSRRSSSRQGSRLMRGMSVEAPHGEAAGNDQRHGVVLHQLRLGLGRQLHLAERVAQHRGGADALLDILDGAGNRGAATADNELVQFGELALRGQEELDGTVDLLGHVLEEWIEELWLVVGGQAAFTLRLAGFLEGQAVVPHDFLGQLLAAE